MPERRDEFYVGYLPMPSGHRRFIRVAVPVLLWVVVGVSVGVSLLQRSPGRGVWDTGKPVDRTGVLRELPYPHVVTADGVVFLVEQGKRGAQERTGGRDGDAVTVRGWRIERDGREIVELVPESDAITPAPGFMRIEEGVERRTAITFRGEIVDYKCYLGAMKPGDGKGHKACAILCLTGGIPAMLVTHPGPQYTLLADERGGPVGPGIIELAGEPVTVEGTLVERGMLRVILVSAVNRNGN